MPTKEKRHTCYFCKTKRVESNMQSFCNPFSGTGISWACKCKVSYRFWLRDVDCLKSYRG